MANIKELFLLSIERGMTAANDVSNVTDRAKIYAEFAKALAMTGMVRENVGPIDNINPKVQEAKEAIKQSVEKAEADKTEKKNEAKKDSKNKKDAPKTEPPKEEVNENWKEEKAEQFGTINQFAEFFGGDMLLSSIAKVVEGVSGPDDITIDNIDDIAEYLWKEGEIIGMLGECDADTIAQLISDFSQSTFNSFDDINPGNIDGFKVYLEKLQEAAAAN